MNSNNWRDTTIGAETDLLTGNPFNSSRYTDDVSGIRLLRGDNVIQGRIRWEDVKSWDRSHVKGLNDYFLQSGDVVLAMDRPWIEAGLKYAAISDDDLPCLLVQRVSRLRGKENLDQRFLKYIIGSRDFTDYILGIQTGTSVPHISAGQIKEFQFLCPPLSEQRAIVRSLGALDDKIEHDRRMNHTLELIVQAVFKSWFLDFDPVVAKSEGRQPYGMNPETAALFPSEFQETGIDEFESIPIGWHLESLSDIANYENGLALQKYRPEGVEYLPVIKIRELRRGFPDSNSEKASPNIKPSCVLDDGDIIFSWSGSLMIDMWCGGKGALNQHLFKVTSDNYPKWFYYYWTNYHLSDFQDIAEGKATTMGHIQRHHLESAKVVVPPDPILEKANKVLQPMLDQIMKNRVQSRVLASMRDALLPKLLSGEIRVKAT